MLRITGTGRNGAIHLKLEGKLLGPWLDELHRACAPAFDRKARVQLDLSAVSFVDAAGVRLLHDLIDRGVQIDACSSFVAELLNLEKP